MLGGQNDHVRPADEGAFPNPSPNSRGTRVRGGNAGIANGSVQLAVKAVNVSVPLCCLIYFVFKVNGRCPCCES